MTNPPPRKRFQIHLSTAIVMMFVAGALIWANTIGRLNEVGYAVDPVSGKYALVAKGFGWPFIFRNGELVNRIDRSSEWKVASNPFMPAIAMIDFVAGLSLLFAVWFLCEYLIRRRAARKGA